MQDAVQHENSALAPPGGAGAPQEDYDDATEEMYDGEAEAEEEEGAEAEEEEEEEEGSSDDEADRREFGIYQCLPVAPGAPNWDAACDDVEEYLRRVRYEAQQLPAVVTAAPLPPRDGGSQQHAADAPNPQQGQQQPQGSRMLRCLPTDPGVAPCDPALKPSAAWTRDFLQQFAALRRRLQREYELGSGQGAAEAAPAGAPLDAVAQAELEALSLDPPSACMPELLQLQGQDQLQVRRQLHSAIRAVVREGELAPEAAALLYALSARIEKPLHAGTCALYRQLLRACAERRAALGSDAAAPALPHLNVLIVIAGAYFGQDEELAAMWDDQE